MICHAAAARVGATVQGRINAVAQLSASLRLSHADHGNVPARLARQDIDTFLNRLAFLADRGDITTASRARTCHHVKSVFAEFRNLGADPPRWCGGRLTR